MSYRDFSLKRVQDTFHLSMIEKPGIFAGMEPHPISPFLSETLQENVPLAVSINTEKARSELIIAPVLVEVRRIMDRRISLFSGIELNVDKENDLSGFCDFIISDSPEQLFLKAPIITIVEAKNENIMSGLGQCLAEMVAARIFNEREGNAVSSMYGANTFGNIWKFTKLDDNIAYIDLDDYSIRERDSIIGILLAMVARKA